MSTQAWVESKVRDRIARIVVLSLVIGYSAAVTMQMNSSTTVAAAPVQTAAIAPTVPAARPAMPVKSSRSAKAAKSAVAKAAQTTPPQTISKQAVAQQEIAQAIARPIPHSEVADLPLQANGHLIVAANDILLTDHHRVRVGELPFRPIKKALINFQRTTKMPSVTLTAAADIPSVHVNVVKKFMERFYGWKVTTNPSDKVGTFELEIAPAQGEQP